MADGKGCKCAAYSESECACDVDWTPQEVYDLREKVQRLEEAIRRLAEQDATLSVCDGNVTVQVDATLTEEEKKGIDGIIRDFQVIAEFNEERCHPHYAQKARCRVAMLSGLLKRLG